MSCYLGHCAHAPTHRIVRDEISIARRRTFLACHKHAVDLWEAWTRVNWTSLTPPVFVTTTIKLEPLYRAYMCTLLYP